MRDQSYNARPQRQVLVKPAQGSGMPATRAGISPRTEAARIVACWLERGAFPDRQVAGIETGRGAVTELVYGVVKQHRRLSWVLANCVERPPALPVAAAMLSQPKLSGEAY